jgi:hypothetical protein
MNTRYITLLTICAVNCSLNAAQPPTPDFSKLIPGGLLANPYGVVVQGIPFPTAAPAPTVTSGGNFWEGAGSAIGTTILTTLAAAIVKSAWDASQAAPDEQKQLQLQIQVIELERKKRDDLLLARFRELNGKYLACKLRKSNCTDIEQEFVMACGQPAMDVIKQTSSN